MNSLLDLRTRKALRDVWGNKPRTALVVLSIMLGMASITTLFRANTIMSRDMTTSYASVNPVAAILFSQPPWQFTDQVLAAVRRVPGVEAVHGAATAVGRIKAGDRWLTLNLIAYDTLSDLNINMLSPQTASWPPAGRTILVERSAAPALAQEFIDGQVTIRAPSGLVIDLPLAGTVTDLSVYPTSVSDSVVYGYVTRDTIAWLGGQRDYNKLLFTVTDGKLDVNHIRQVAQQVQRTVEDELQFSRTASMQDLPGPVNRVEIPTPYQSLLAPSVISINWLLNIMAVSAMVLSAFLVTNTITALLARQVRQIGSMKAIGAPDRDIVTIYLGVVVMFSFIAALISQPIGTIGAAAVAIMAGGALNFDMHPFDIPAWHIAAEIAVGVAVPMLAALGPIRRALRMTVREAMDDSGRVVSAATDFDRMLERLHGLPSATLYALRNTFRNKGRLILTILTLSLGGAVVMAVVSVAGSIAATVETARSYWQEDVMVDLLQPASLHTLQQVTRFTPGIDRVSGSLLLKAMHIVDGRDTYQSVDLFGVQLDTGTLTPTLLSGRWLTADDAAGLVMNTNFARQEGVRVGDTVTLRLSNGRKKDWRVIGLVTSEVRGGLESLSSYSPVAGYVNIEELGRVSGYEGKVTRLAVITQQHDTASQQQGAIAVEDSLTRAGYRVISSNSANQQQNKLHQSLAALLQLLWGLAILFTVVGGLGMLGTLSMNVLERTREVGVLRAVGIESSDLRRIVLTEAILIGVFCWVLACCLTVPLSIVLNNFLGLSVLNTPFTLIFPLWTPLAWLGMVLVIAVIASLLPAQNAVDISVREALIYE